MTDTSQSGAPRLTPAAYRPLLRVGRVLCLGCALITAGGVAIGDVYLAAVHAAFGAFGLFCWLLASGYTMGYNTSTKHHALDAAPTARPERIARAAPVTWTKVPVAAQGEGYLYVIRFSSGTVKVGMTTDPPKRLNEHRRYGWAFGVLIADAWVSEAHPGHEANETKLIDYAASTATGDRARREFFHGADFDQLVEFAAGLAGPAPV